jgi:poly(A) polymerase
VRDLLLGREPADYDVATDATPADVMRIFPRTWAVGAQFGVVLVPFDHEEQSEEPTGESREAKADRRQPAADRRPPTAGAPHTVEVATFRSDGKYSDSRHPDEVRYATRPEEDVRRRDFTINGLLLDPLDENRVLDFVGGCADLRRGIVRTIGDPRRRFDEDKLRLLRAVRFAGRFGYRIEAQTLAAIRELAPQIGRVSRERVRDELTKMLTEGRARRAFELLDQTGLLREVLPEVAKMKGVPQPPQFHPEGDVWIHSLSLLERLPAECARTLAWGALLHDVGKPPTFRVAPDRIRFDGHVEIGEAIGREICRRLRMSNDDTGQILALIANHMRFMDAPRMKQSTMKRFLRLPRFGEHLELHRLDCLASHGDLGIYHYVREQYEQTPPDRLRPSPFITGRDLIALGLRPGPEFRAILAAVEDAQLEGQLTSRDAALKFARERAASSKAAGTETQA